MVFQSTKHNKIINFVAEKETEEETENGRRK